MKIFKCSPLTGNTNHREIPIRPADYRRWMNGTPIQHAAPYLSIDDREYLISGLMPGEFEKLLGIES